jgi:chromosome segregation ATPase
MTDEHRARLEKKLVSGAFSFDTEDFIRGALAEIDRLKAAVATNSIIDAGLRTENGRRMAEINEQKAEIDRLRHDLDIVTYGLGQSTTSIQEKNREIDRLRRALVDLNECLDDKDSETDKLKAELYEKTTAWKSRGQDIDRLVGEKADLEEQVAKFRVELSDANVQLDVYRAAVDAHNGPDIGAMHKNRQNLNYLNGTIRKQTKEAALRVAELTGLQAKLCEYKSRIAVLEGQLKAPPETLAISELHNRVAALEATLKNAKTITHIPSGRIYFEVPC